MAYASAVPEVYGKNLNLRVRCSG